MIISRLIMASNITEDRDEHRASRYSPSIPWTLVCLLRLIPLLTVRVNGRLVNVKHPPSLNRLPRKQPLPGNPCPPRKASFLLNHFWRLSRTPTLLIFFAPLLQTMIAPTIQTAIEKAVDSAIEMLHSSILNDIVSSIVQLKKTIEEQIKISEQQNKIIKE